MMSRLMSCAAALILLAVASPAAAQYMHREDLPMHERQRLQGDADSRNAASAEQARKDQAERERQRRVLLKKPPLPAERNGLLGSWRLGEGQQSSVGGLGRGAGRGGLGDIVGILSSMNLEKVGCEMGLGGGITFAPSTYSRVGIDGRVAGSATYRSASSGSKQFTVAIGDRLMIAFEVAGPNRIVDEDGCVLVRVGAPGATAATNATAAPGSARTGAANSSVPPAAGATPKSSTALQVAGTAGVVVDGAAFRCGDGSLLHVSLCQGNADDANCKLTELHLPGLQMGKPARRADIAARVKGCEAGGIRYGADDKPVFVR